MTWAVYAYRPVSLRALIAIMEHEVIGQTARFQRFVADMLYAIAAGRKIDPDKTPRFAQQVDEVYRNPFQKAQKQLKTTAEIKEHILGLIRKTRESLSAEG